MQLQCYLTSVYNYHTNTPGQFNLSHEYTFKSSCITSAIVVRNARRKYIIFRWLRVWESSNGNGELYYNYVTKNRMNGRRFYWYLERKENREVLRSCTGRAWLRALLGLYRQRCTRPTDYSNQDHTPAPPTWQTEGRLGKRENFRTSVDYVSQQNWFRQCLMHQAESFLELTQN